MLRKIGRGKKPKASPYVRNDNRELRKVVIALRNLVKETVPGTRETENAWGVPTFESKTPFCFYMVGKNHVTFGFHNPALKLHRYVEKPFCWCAV